MISELPPAPTLARTACLAVIGFFVLAPAVVPADVAARCLPLPLGDFVWSSSIDESSRSESAAAEECWEESSDSIDMPVVEG